MIIVPCTMLVEAFLLNKRLSIRYVAEERHAGIFFFTTVLKQVSQ